jgi:molybdate transport system substrate-binding protein
VVLAAPAVPAGNYALQVLDKLAADPAYGPTFKDSVTANVVSREDNVRQVLAKVQLGEADAGIVYVTDARGAKVGTIDIPDQYNVVAQYFIAVLRDAPNEPGARTFVGYLLSDAGQKTLQDFGFGPPLPQ